ncbi:MAG: hypothetical protein U0997_05905 [Sulfurimicrobium sp.]|nr:hypothetical protein [Sulfurimicrobium sp.]
MMGTIIQFHPATKILLWLGFAIAMQGMGVMPLTLLSVVGVMVLLAGRSPGALLMVRRARWLLLSLLVIYAFATPGDALIPQLGSYAPSIQGVRGGAMQAWRLVLLLLALGWLLRSCPRNSLLSGLYILMKPFAGVGIDADRIAVRLWLTLQYAEQQPRRNAHGWWNELRLTLDPAPDAATEIILEMPAFTWRDAVILVFATFFFGLLLW